MQKSKISINYKNFNSVKTLIMISAAVLMITALTLPAAAVDIGGKLSLETLFSHQDQMQTDFNSELELELLLPEEKNLNLDAVFVLRANSLDSADNSDFWVKKLNLSRKIAGFQTQLGRQPISWSYGSLLNPIDYSLGAENLDQETDAKFLDGLELYYPLSWKTGFTLIMTDSGADKNKWALRGRTLLGGYDLTANYIREPAVEINGSQNIEHQHRFSLTVKGDLGPLGVYGALGSWHEDNDGEELDIYQLGSDYSYYFLAGSQIYLQGELLRIDSSRALSSADNYLSSSLINSILPITALENKNIDQKKLDFLIMDINYTVNEFLSYGVTLLNYPDDGSTTLIPNYNYTFSSNLQLELRGMLPLSDDDKLLGGDRESLTATLSYTF